MKAKKMYDEEIVIDLDFKISKYEILSDYIKDDELPNIYISPYVTDADENKISLEYCRYVNINKLFETTEEAIDYIKNSLKRHIKKIEKRIEIMEENLIEKIEKEI